MAGCARHLEPGGCLIAGFQLDRGYSAGQLRRALPAGRARSPTGDGPPGRAAPFTDGGDYAVSVHRPSLPPLSRAYGACDPPGASDTAPHSSGRRGTSAIMGAPGKDTMRNPMFVFDEQLTTLILDYCRWRLALDPVPLDFGGAQASLAGRTAWTG